MKSILCSLFILMAFLTTAQEWKTYPYHQPDTYIYFPTDEGVHSSEPTEWWYMVSHLTGQTSGNYYTCMLTYFHYPDLGFDGFRIFNLANETEDKFYPQTLPVLYDILAEDSLYIETNPVGAANETWKNMTNPDGTMVPFKYEVDANQTNGSIDFVLDTYKRPLVVGDSGYFYQGGNGNYTYYYSQTGVSVTGSLTIDGNTEEVTGTAWIDRQYGTFNPYSGEVYEWFSIQLSNDVDLNIWNIFTTENQIPDTSTYVLCSAYVNDSTSFSTSDFELQRLQYVFTPDTIQCYSQKWNFTYQDIDLTFITMSPDREVEVPFRFYEGAVEVNGTYNDEEVTGFGFAELLHSYEIPELAFLNPGTDTTWIEEGATIQWHALNPDDGNPLYYSLYYSTDGGDSYEEIVSETNDTSYYWDFSHLEDETVCNFKLTGSSIDGTLRSTIISDDVTLYIVTSTNDNVIKQNQVSLYPNPTNGFVEVLGEDISSIKVYQSDGNMIKSFKFDNTDNSDQVSVDLTGEMSGIYLLKILDKNGLTSKKLILR